MNSTTATVVNQGIAWRDTYGSRSAAAFLAQRAVPCAVIQRVINIGDIRAIQTSTRAATPSPERIHNRPGI